MPIFGDTSVGAGSFPTTNDRAIVGSFVLTDNADCTSITNRFDPISTAGSNFKGLIYADSGGLPGALVAVGAPAAIPAGGGLVDSAVTVTLAPGTYWLGGVVDSFQGRWQTNVITGGQRREAHTYASPADPFASPASTGERVQAYVTYTVSGGLAFAGLLPPLSFVIGQAGSVDLSSYFTGVETPFTFALDGASAALPSGVTLSTAGVLSWSGAGAVADTGGIIVQATDDVAATADTNAFIIQVRSVPKMRTPYERSPRGGDIAWGRGPAGDVLVNDFFDAAAATTTLAKVWNGTAWVVKPVKYWNGSAWVTKPVKRWSGSAWV